MVKVAVSQGDSYCELHEMERGKRRASNRTISNCESHAMGLAIHVLGNEMHTKVLVKVNNHERSLEKLMGVVRESEFQVRNLNARLSLDESVFLLTMEVEGSQPTSALSEQLRSMTEVRSVEFSA